MKYIIYGINNKEYYRVEAVEFEYTKEDAEKTKKEFEKIYPVVEIETE